MQITKWLPRCADCCGRPGAPCWLADPCARSRPDVRATPAGRRDEAANAAGSWDAEFVGAYGRPRRRRLEDDEWGGGWGFGGFGAPSASGRDARGYYGVLGVDPGCSTSEIQARHRRAPALPRALTRLAEPSGLVSSCMPAKPEEAVAAG